MRTTRPPSCLWGGPPKVPIGTALARSRAANTAGPTAVAELFEFGETWAVDLVSTRRHELADPRRGVPLGHGRRCPAIDQLSKNRGRPNVRYSR